MVLSQSLWATRSFRLRLLDFQMYEFAQNLDIVVEHILVRLSDLPGTYQKFGSLLHHSFFRKTNFSSLSIYSLLFGENSFGSGHDYLKLNFAHVVL